LGFWDAGFTGWDFEPTDLERAIFERVVRWVLVARLTGSDFPTFPPLEFNIDPATGRPPAIFTVGVFPVGVFPVGVFPVGVFPVGVFPVGVFPVGVFTVGVFTTVLAEAGDRRPA